MQGDLQASPAERVGLFFASIERNLTDAREAHRHQCIEFFNQLEPQLTAAREIDRQLNHHLAHRFNVFRYLKDDELGLSRIIADLLTPNAAHGQGPKFLRLLMDMLELEAPAADVSGAKVFVERSIEGNRRIDIYVEISSGDKSYGLAIENKPFDKDRKQQVKDYLEHLDRRFDQFHLIYLSPTGEPPGETSLPKSEYKNWQDRFLIMPYHHRRASADDADGEGSGGALEEYRAPCSLTEWLDACRTQCEAQRLRWFLSDAESYCRRTFGEADMASDLETKTVVELLEKEPSHLETARVVYESWPEVRDGICKQFLEHLRDRIRRRIKKENSELAQDACVEAQYQGEGRGNVNRLSIYLNSRPQHPATNSVALEKAAIRLRPGARVWYGVWSPPNQDLEGELRAEFRDSEKPDDGYPVWWWVGNDWSNWHKIVPELHQETEDNRGGAITDYYVETLVEFAKRAIPIISNAEGSQPSQN